MIDPVLAERVLSAPVDRYGSVGLPRLFDCAFCDGPPISVSFYDAEVPRNRALTIISRVSAITKADRAAFEPMLWAFYCKEIEDGLGNFDTTEEQLAWELEYDSSKTFAGARPATCHEEVWPLVRFDSMGLRMTNGTLTAQIGGTAAWDAEHGCTFIFDEAGTLLKVGPW
jgi:hypothetical protein